MSQFTSATAVGKEIREPGSEWKVQAGCFEISGSSKPSLTWAGGEQSISKVCVVFRVTGEEDSEGQHGVHSLCCITQTCLTTFSRKSLSVNLSVQWLEIKVRVT